jgi:uncharacterized Zn finger protein (UPF0148 family)
MSLRCDFCGLEFEPDCAEFHCTTCPLARNCGKVSCPRCGYTFPAEAVLVQWLRRLRPPTHARATNPRTEKRP